MCSAVGSSRLRVSVQPIRAVQRDALKTPHRGVFLTGFRLLSLSAKQKTRTVKKDSPRFFGPSDRSRTCGLLNPIQARYQTALHPVGLIIIAQVFTKCKPFFEKTFNFFREFKNGGTGPIQALFNIVKITEKTGVYFTEVTKIS